MHYCADNHSRQTKEIVHIQSDPQDISYKSELSWFAQYIGVESLSFLFFACLENSFSMWDDSFGRGAYLALIHSLVSSTQINVNLHYSSELNYMILTH